MTFRILTVCTGNICRSPLAEQLLRADLAGLDIEVSSAGTMALVGQPMPAQAQTLARRLGGVGTDEHAARKLTEQLVRESDLILGLAREHRRSVVELLPAATRKAFTLREFAHLTASVTPEDLSDAALGQPDPIRAAVVAAASLRGLVEPLESPEANDVIDPYRRSDEVYEQSAAELAPAARETARYLRSVAAGAV